MAELNLRTIDVFGKATLDHQGEPYMREGLYEYEDGSRVALVRSLSALPAGENGLWVRIHSRGAAALVAPHEGRFAVITLDRFMEERTTNFSNQTYGVAESEWTLYDSFPTLEEITELRMGVAPEKPQGGFVQLHCHSEMSPLDGLATIEEIVQKAEDLGQWAVAVTDHGVCSGHPTLQEECEKRGIHPVFGIEANLVDDKSVKDKDSLHAYWHIIMWAETTEGLRNIWAMTTEANRDGFYGRPRVDWETLERYSKGVMVSTGCLRGPISRAILDSDDDLARQRLGRLMEIFPDNLYVEIQTNQMEEQAVVNRGLVALAREYQLPLIAAADSHYASEDDGDVHKIWIASQTGKTLADEQKLFTGDESYHMESEEEVRDALGYLPQDVVEEAIANTSVVAHRAQARVEGEASVPVFSKGDDPIERDVSRLVDLCLSNWGRCLGKTHPEEVYIERFEREMGLLIEKGFCGYYMMVSDYCRWARDHGILVGPGRGSGSGSLVAYLSGITGIDPVETGLLFERFLTKGRTALPDFDVDFPASKRAELTEYIVNRYGEENVVRVGTHIRLKNKGVIRDLARVLDDRIGVHYPDINAISQIIEEAEADFAGLGQPWEDLIEQHSEALDPYRQKYPLIFEYANKLVGRLKTYGKHAAGLVIAPNAELTKKLPLRSTGDDLVAEFDMETLEKLGLVKFDILTLRTLDTIQMCVDLVREELGVHLNIAKWDHEYEDPEVWREISDGHTLGLFQIETSGATRDAKRFKPQSLRELADVITLIRPGPKRSGLTEVYFRRKMGQEDVTYLDPRLEPILQDTWGTMIYQEQVMKICRVLAGYDEEEADHVRKILGKKKVELAREEGEKFKRRAVANGTDLEVATKLWDQMEEFSRYAFNLSHAYGYAMLGYWTAFLKVKYPVQFLTSVMSTVDKGRLPEFVTEARRMGVKVLPPDINKSGHSFRSSGEMEIRYGFEGVKGIGAAAMEALIAGQPYQDWDDFVARKGKANWGVVKLLARIGAFDSLVPNRKGLEQRLSWETEGGGDVCVFKNESKEGAPNGLPCDFDWDSEEPEIGKSGRKLKQKPIPKKCTRRCRNFTPPETPDFNEVAPYTEKQIMDIEMELLGVHLTHTPFDSVPDWIWGEETTEELGQPVVLGSYAVDGPEADYVVVATVSRCRPHTAKNGKNMGFMGLYAVDAELDVTVFSDAWTKFHKDIRKGDLYLAYVHKNERGFSLLHLQPL